MRLPSRRPTAPEPPGLVGTARVLRRTPIETGRLAPGDVAVLHHTDLDAATARLLLERKVAVVLNGATFVSGSYPTLGPQLLSDAGVLLLEASPEELNRVPDGARLRIHEGVVHNGDAELFQGRLLGPADVTRLREDARDGMARQLDAVTHNSAELLRREQDVLLHAEGLPTVRTPFQDRAVVVVARGSRHDEELHALHRFVVEQRPLLVGVDAGARVLLEQGLRPDLVLLSAGLVGTDSEDALSEDAVRAAAEVVLHQRRSDTGSGQERLQRWGVTAAGVTTDVHPFDVALLLAHAGGARLVVPVGRDGTFEEFLDRGRSDQASALLTRLRVGDHLVAASAVPALYSGRVRAWHLLLIVLVALLALVLAVATTPIGNVWWHDVGHWFVNRYDDLRGLL